MAKYQGRDNYHGRIPLKCPDKHCNRPLVWGEGYKREPQGCGLCSDFIVFATFVKEEWSASRRHGCLKLSVIENFLTRYYVHKKVPKARSPKIDHRNGRTS